MILIFVILVFKKYERTWEYSVKFGFHELRMYCCAVGDAVEVDLDPLKWSHTDKAAAAAAKSLSRVRLCAAPWTAAHQAPPSMGFSRQEYWSRGPLPSLTDKARTPQKRCYQHPELPHLYFIADSATSNHFSFGARGRQLLFFLLSFDLLLVSPDRT